MEALAKVRSEAASPQRKESLISTSAWRSKDEGGGTLLLAPCLRRATRGSEDQAEDNGL